MMATDFPRPWIWFPSVWARELTPRQYRERCRPLRRPRNRIPFWLRDESLADSSNLPDPDVIAAEIIDELRAALEEFEQLQAGLQLTSAELEATD